MMRNVCLSALFALIFCAITPECFAEKIFYKDGGSACETIVKRDSNSLWIKRSGGISAIGLENIDRIQNDDGSVSRYDYESICAMLETAIKEDKYDDAVKLCDLLLEAFSKNPQIHYLRGLLWQKVGNYAKSAEDYNFVIQNEAADDTVFNNLGVIYARDKNYKSAVDLFMKAMEKNPQSPETHENLVHAKNALQGSER